MLLKDYFDFLNPNTIRIKGHRLGIEDVLELYEAGYSPEQIALEFSGLSLEKIHATILYYWRNKQDVEAYLSRLDKVVAESQQEEAAQKAPEVVRRIRTLQAERTQSSPSA